MNVLILGGTSFVGPEIARLLKKSGHHVGLFNRGLTPCSRTAGFQTYQGDVKNDADLKRVAKEKKWNVVIHQLAYQRSDVERVLEIFPGLKRVILTFFHFGLSLHPPNEKRTPTLHAESQVDYDS